MPVPRSSSRALVLGVWLSAAAITGGCYPRIDSSPRDAESKHAVQALKRHLRADRIGDVSIRQLPVSVLGWRLFTGTPNMCRSTRVFYWVVRADGSVVTSSRPGDRAELDQHGSPDSLEELSRIYRSLEIVRSDSLVNPEDLAWFAVALLGEDERLLVGHEYQYFSSQYEDAGLVLPQLVRKGDGVTLVFWSSDRPDWHHYELQISAAYEITVSVTSRRLDQ